MSQVKANVTPYSIQLFFALSCLVIDISTDMIDWRMSTGSDALSLFHTNKFCRNYHRMLNKSVLGNIPRSAKAFNCLKPCGDTYESIVKTILFSKLPVIYENIIKYACKCIQIFSIMHLYAHFARVTWRKINENRSLHRNQFNNYYPHN